MRYSDKKFFELILKYFKNIPRKEMFVKGQIKWSSVFNQKSNQAFYFMKGNFPGLFDNEKFRSLSQIRKTNKSDKKNIDGKPKEKVVKRRYNYLDLTKLFQDLKMNVPSMKASKPIPKWKTDPPKITIDAINSKTSHILSSLREAETQISKLKRVEELLNHLIEHPDSKTFAVKTGAINDLLNTRVKTADPTTHEIIRMVLAVLGYANPPGSSGVRILSIDGGGMRGIAVIRMLQKIEEITGQKIYDLFDFICGVSTGAIITCGLIPPNRLPLTRIYDLYRELSSKVFNQSAFWGASKLVWSHAYYDTSIWENFLKTHVGCLNLLELNRDSSCPKIAVVSTIVNHSKVTPYVFRNYGNPSVRGSEYLGSFRHTMFEAVRASAAAPTIFEEFKTGDIMHQDGGIVVNNPTAIALHEARCLWPNEKINCVVSIGTGKHDPIYSVEEQEASAKLSTTWKQIFDKILESATDTEAVHRILNDLLPDNTYYRLNPHLSRSVTMDETNDEKLIALEKDTQMYCRRNEDKFYELAERLTRPRTVSNILRDAIVLQMRLSGFKM